MRSWELSRNIIAFFQSYPVLMHKQFSFFSTIISQNYQLYRSFHSSFDNPELKSDPFEIVEEIVQLLKQLPQFPVCIDLQTNIDYIHESRHQAIFETYIVPMIQAISSNATIYEYREMELDLFSLKGLFDDKKRSMIPDTVNAVIYV